MNNRENNDAETSFKHALDECSFVLSREAIADVFHYLKHSELEIAFESLLLSINQEKPTLSSKCKTTLYDLGSVLGVDKEGVLIDTNWPTLSAILKPHE